MCVALQRRIVLSLPAPRPVVGFVAMTVILLPRRKWTRGIRWMWIVMVALGIVVAIADGLRR